MDGRYFRTGLPKGFPDLFGISPGGHAFFIEVKRPGGRLSAEQKQMSVILQKFPVFYAVCHSVDEADRFLEEIFWFDKFLDKPEKLKIFKECFENGI